MVAVAPPTRNYISPEEYLRREERSLKKSEYIAGRIRAMSGGSFSHTRLITNLGGIGWTITKGKVCQFLGSETKVLIGTGPRYFYPDGTISCPPNIVNDRSGVIDNPKVVFEVLSPGTEDYDRGEKFFAYTSLSSIEQIVLISSSKRRVDVWTRIAEGWRPEEVLDGTLTLASVHLEIALDELYENVLFDKNDSQES